jgi:hypothetical protein
MDRLAHAIYRLNQYPNKRTEHRMHIDINDPELEARIQKQIQATGGGNVLDALNRILQTQEEQDRWLLENRAEIDSKIKLGIEQLDRGEGVPEDQLDAFLAQLKFQSE